jgi:hypothetical protein
MRLNLSLENVHYQNNDKHLEKIEKAIEEIVAYGNNKYPAAYYREGLFITRLIKSQYDLHKDKKLIELYHKLEDLIKERFGLNIKVNLTDEIFFSIAAIYTPLKTNMTDHIFLFSRAYEELYTTKVREAYVDFKRAYVSGFYSDTTTYMNIDFHVLSLLFKINPKEITAIMLHEIGHLFEAIVYHYRTTRSNLVIENVLQELSNNKPDKARYILNNNLEDKKTIYSKDHLSDDRVDMLSDIFGYYAKVKGYDTYVYYEVNDESMADYFSTKMGYGKELVTGLSKFYGIKPELMEGVQNIAISNTSDIYKDIISNKMLKQDNIEFDLPFLSIALGVGKTLKNVLGGVVDLLSISLFTYWIRHANGRETYTYDRIEDRLRRVRNTIVNELIVRKRKGSDKLKTLVDKIDLIDKIIEKIGTDPINLDEYFTSKGAFNRKLRELDHQYEMLMLNDFHVLAVKVKEVV